MGKQELIVYGKGSKERKTYLTDGAKFYLRRYLQTRNQEEGLENKPLFETLDKPHDRMTVAGVQLCSGSWGSGQRWIMCIRIGSGGQSPRIY